jgi:hypothetical protein
VLERLLPVGRINYALSHGHSAEQVGCKMPQQQRTTACLCGDILAVAVDHPQKRNRAEDRVGCKEPG